jgi:hypothetical protein
MPRITSVYNSPIVHNVRAAFARACTDPTAVPSMSQLSQILNAVFFASLLTEEGQLARVALAISGGEDALNTLTFSRRLPCSPDTLAKLSPALAQGTAYAAVSLGGRHVKIWGIRVESVVDPVVRTIAPGHLVISVNGETVADLARDRVQVMGATIQDWTTQVARFLWNRGFTDDHEIQVAWNLRFLADAMRHGRGGTLLIVDDSNAWRDSVEIKHPIASDRFRLAKLQEDWSVRSAAEKDSLDGPKCLTYMVHDTGEALDYKAVAGAIGRLTAVDGATILDRSLTVLAFGAKIRGRTPAPKEVWYPAPLGANASGKAMRMSKVGGMRHQSAIQFVHDNPGAVALVASQDGALSLFASDGLVQALRCDIFFS